MATVPYGLQRNIELPDDTPVVVLQAPRGHAVDDVRKALIDAVHQPLDFPPLTKAVVAGDAVTLVIGPRVPRAEAIVAALVEVLLAAGVAAGDITILCEPLRTGQAGSDPLAGLSPQVRTSVRLLRHDSESRDELAYLAASQSGEAIYFNRAICDADVVVPVEATAPPRSRQAVFDSQRMYPAFADRAGQQRLMSTTMDPGSAGTDQPTISDEAEWLLGVALVVEIVPGRPGEALHVLVGEPASVRQQAAALAAEAWSFPLDEPAEIVIATIEGGPDEQTWENVGRAVQAASAALEAGGAIVLCTQLADAPGPAVARLVDCDDRWDELHKSSQHGDVDALTAGQLVRALDDARVYLLSDLEESTVEDLGIAPIADAEQLARLVGRCRSCIVLGNAHRATIRIAQR